MHDYVGVDLLSSAIYQGSFHTREKLLGGRGFDGFICLFHACGPDIDVGPLHVAAGLGKLLELLEYGAGILVTDDLDEGPDVHEICEACGSTMFNSRTFHSGREFRDPLLMCIRGDTYQKCLLCLLAGGHRRSIRAE